MMRPALGACLAALLCVPLAGQSAPPPARFEVADVHPSPPSALPVSVMRIAGPRNGRYELRRATMVDLIRTAYGVEAEKVVGGPHWLELDRFDVIAATPPSTTRDTVKTLLLALLVDRFGLVARQEIKPVNAQALVRGAGELRMTAAPGGIATTCQQGVQPGAGNTGLSLTLTCRGITMAAFAEQLGRVSGNIGVTGPFADATGLAGSWDFDLRFVPAQLVTQLGGTTFSEALAQLGLAFDKKDVPMATITVDSVNRTPTPNDAAAVAKAFPPEPPPEFEVAVLKRSAPGSRPNMQILNGQVNLAAIPLRTLIALAWDAPTPTSIVGSGVLDTVLFDVVGRTSTGPSDGQAPDREVLGPMLRKLVLESLDIKVRTEDRPGTAHSLVLDGSHKLVKADPAARTRCTVVSAQTPRGASPVPAQTMTCQNVTMTELADRLRQVGGAFFQVPVTDETNLEGRWNFSMTFVPPGLAQLLAAARGGLPPGGAGAAGGLAASEPSGVMTLEEAIDRQLGLKLRARQRQVPTIVVDYSEEKPAN